MATSVRLPKDIEDKLDSISHVEQVSKAQIIKKSLTEYFEKHYSEKSSYDLGEKYFGKHGTGQPDLAKNRKKYLEKVMYDKKSGR